MSACLCATAWPIKGLSPSSFLPGAVEHAGGQALINFVTEHRGRLFQLGSRFGRCKRVDIRGGLVF
jgi:hypothetical protein